MFKDHQIYSPAWFLYKAVRCVREQRVPSFLTRLNSDVIKALFWRQPGLLKFKEYSDQHGLQRAIQQDDRLWLKWRITRRAPRLLYGAGGAQIGHLLYVICGYTNLNVVNDQIYTFDMKNRRWHQLVSVPQEMAHSHLGVCVEKERYIYIISGQRGNQRAPAVCDSFVFDTKALCWSSLPPLPLPRYAPIAQIIEGRLHIAGGSAEDRVTPARDHWSIAVKDGKALETEWRKEPPIPRGGPHRGSIVVDGNIYVFGGQEGDYQAIEGDPQFTCRWKTTEFYHPECYRYVPARQRWERLADMPVTASHTDYSVLRWRDYILVIGGQVHNNKDNFLLPLTDCIQAYDLKAHTWFDFGRLPYRIKSVVAGIWEDALFVTTGQRDRSSSDLTPQKVVDHCWWTNLNLLTKGHHDKNHI